MQQPINNFLEKMMTQQEFESVVRRLAGAFNEETRYTALAGAMMLLLRAEYIRQKETPDSGEPGAEGGNCK